MSCIDENQVLQYVEGLYDEEEARAIEAHLAECADCRYLLAAAGGAALMDSPSMAPTRTLNPDDELLAPGASERRSGEVLQDTYVIERFIGAGGMGAVYEGSHRRLARRFAIKFITEARVSDAEAVARMQREAYVTSRLSHPNIVQVTDFNYADDGAPFIVMELLEGESLAELLMREGALSSLDLVSSISRQVTSALEAAHREGIVHRDLTPGNIFLCPTEGGEPLVKVMDFGLSKILERARHGAQQSAANLTRVVSVLGSPHFMSPEQATGHSANVDHRADVFSFGAILYRMLAGRPPFGGADPQEVMRQVAFEAPAAAPQWLRVPDPLRAVVDKALNKEAPLRQRSMRDLWTELEVAIEAVQGGDASTPAARVTGLREVATASGLVDLAPSLVMVDDLADDLEDDDLEDDDLADDLMPSPVRRPPRRRGAVLLAAVLLVASVVIVFATALLPYGGERSGQRDPDQGASPNSGIDGRRSAPPADAAVTLRLGRRPDAGGKDPGAAARPRLPRRPRAAKVRRPRRQPRRVGHGTISVQTISADGRPLWADLYLDGRKVGQTALTVERVAAGRHLVEVRRRGFRPVSRTVRVKPGRRLRVQLPMRATSP